MGRVVVSGIVLALGLSLWQLLAAESGIQQDALQVGDTPAWVYRSEGAGPYPVVVVAHGFAGSRRLMEPLALALASRGYIALTYDLLGHGRHPVPMSGDLETADAGSTTDLLLQQLDEVVQAAAALPGSDGRVALAGHSMATDILVRYAQDGVGALRPPGSSTPPGPSSATPILATVGISMFAPTVDSASPRNLLAIAGAWEGRLTAEGRRVVSMVEGIEPTEVRAFQTYGDPSEGTARRLAIAPHVEHVGVLYSAKMLEETVAWLDGTVRRQTDGRGSRGGVSDVRGRGRGLWIALLMVSVFFLARPLSAALPRVSDRPLGANASWRRVLLVAGIPALVTPLLLRPVPTGFLPVVVGDYVAVHFLTVGLLTAALLWWTGGRPGLHQVLVAARGSGGGAVPVADSLTSSPEGVPPPSEFSRSEPAPEVKPGRPIFRTLVGAALMVGFFLLLVAWPLDRFFTSFVPVGGRVPLLLAVLLGTLPYFMADEWLTRGPEARGGAYAVTKVLFLVSLSLAVALDFEGLFFLVLIIPLIVVFFAIHGLLSRWAYRTTGSPLVAGLANAVAFAWALAVTFPLYAGP